MKIAFVVGRFPVLSETFVLNQVTGLIDRGHELEIFSIDKQQKLTKVHPDVEKYNLLSRTYYRQMPYSKLWRFIKAIGLIITSFYKDPIAILRSLNVLKYGRQASSLRLLYSVLLFLNRGSYDIFHCHFGPSGNLAALLKDLGVIEGKIVTVFHGHDMSMYLREQGDDIYNFLFDKGDLFLPISEKWKRKLVELGCDERKIIVHRMGIDVNRFQFSPSRDSSDTQVLSVARLVEKKGIEYGIGAVAKVLEKHPNIEYKIAGDGPLSNELKDLINRLELKHKVKLLGWLQQNEVIELIQKADILLAPSVTGEDGDQEGIPVTIMEALVSGLPVLATQHSGIPELVRDGEFGFLVPERDVDALAERLEYLIEHSEIWAEMGRAGRRFIVEYYNIHKLNDRLVEIYQKLLDFELPESLQEAIA